MPIKDHIKSLLPNSVLAPMQRLHYRFTRRKIAKAEASMIAQQKQLHKEAVAKIIEKEGPLNVIFFAIMDSVWKYDTIYNMMAADPRFNPTILVCPVVNYGRDNMLNNMDKCYNLFVGRGYNVVRAYNPVNNHYIDVRKDLNPDIIFYTNPYEGLIDNRYFIKRFRDILTVYVNYYFSEGKEWDSQCNLILHNLLWKRYCETEEMVQACRRYSRNKGTNAVLTGYPGIDKFIKEDSTATDVWKIKDRKIKRIIWAPHHTISDYAPVFYSTFLSYSEFMLELAKKYNGRIQIAFKPHPILKNRLNIMWGKEKTTQYYNTWDTLNNGMLNDSDYEDLFLTSDAIIHDSGSFIGEYLYTRKPAMFLSNGIPFDKQYNQTAQACLKNYYIGKTKDDIEQFIINLIEGADPLREQRLAFIDRELMPPNGKLASENIIDDIVKSLKL
jgi:hypothetical protein